MKNAIKILIVDDHALLREGISALFKVHEDIEIVGEAADGEEAIGKTAELNPDVIVMDISMEGMDGIEASRRIKKHNPKVKILILSQYDTREFVISSIKAGATGFLPKIAMGQEMVTAVRTLNRGGTFLYPSAARVLIDDYLRQKEEDHYDALTEREREIIKLIADGRTTGEIAESLYCSPATIRVHRTNIMKKLDIHNQTGLIRYALNKHKTIFSN